MSCIHADCAMAAGFQASFQIQDFEIDWDGPGDSSIPVNWALWYRAMVIAFASFSTWVVWVSVGIEGLAVADASSIFYSTLYTSGIPGMLTDFGGHTQTANLGITTYLIGLALGSVLVSPLSEVWGKKPVVIGGLSVFVATILPCALADSLKEILVLRFFW